MENQIDSAVKRGRAYWFVDGFIELSAGILFLILGGAVLLRGWAVQEGYWTWFTSAAVDFGILKMVALLSAVLIIWWLKDRFTYPRTGFIRGNRVPPAAILAFIRNIILLVILPVLGLVAAVFFLPSLRNVLYSIPVWLPIGIGVLWGMLCLIAGEWMGLRRFRAIGVLILIAGITIGIWQLWKGIPTLPAEALQANWLEPIPETLRVPLDEILSRFFASIGLLTLMAGVTFLISGWITFLRYRRENPVPYREDA